MVRDNKVISDDYEFNDMRYLSMCIEFDDPITNGKGYACVDYEYTDMVKPLENFNSQLTGYYFISFVGFSNLFFFHLKAVAKTSTDEIFRWADNYILDEPELSLGNQYISDVIVPHLNNLANAKKRIVIATHNANIAVRKIGRASCRERV